MRQTAFLKWPLVRPLAAALLGALLFFAGGAAQAFTCPDFPEPTVSLDYGSRYKKDSKTRSEKDVESDTEVTAALKPSDDFVRQLSDLSNKAVSDPDLRQEATRCILSGIADWAKADAFGDIRTMTAKISYPARVGGIASAYRLVLPFAEDYPAERKSIENWLRQRTDEIVDYWNTDAPPKAKQANLRAWAALEVTQAGLILDEPSYLDWGLLSQRIILDTQDPDGSLPLEMRRGKWGLHYQLHAMAPMNVTTALLCHAGYRNPKTYEELLDKAVRFSLKAIEDPSLVKLKNGKKQTVEPGLDNQEAFVLAWLEAYLNFSFDPQLDERLKTMRPLSNSKLGGNMTTLFRNNPSLPLGCRDRDK